MKLNLEFNNEEESELSKLSEKIQTHLNDNYEEVKSEDSSIDLMLVLSGIRKNIINWYPLDKNKNVLEIGANYGEITGYLCEFSKNVTAIEHSLQKANILAKRHEDKANLECIVGYLKDIKLNQKYDYVVMIGQIEKANEWFPESDEPEKELLLFASNMLKDDGKILLATDNKFGMQYWNGKIDGQVTYKNLIYERAETGTKLFSEKKLKQLIEDVGYKEYKFYYVFPDYKMPNLICTKDYNITKEDITRDFQYYALNELINFREIEAYSQLIDEDIDIFHFFANSFFVEISSNKIQNDIKYVTFSNYRKEKYRTMTIIKEDEVIKKAANKKATQHINNIVDNNKILSDKGIKIIEHKKDEALVSKFIKSERFDVFLERINEKDFLYYFEKYASILFEGAIEYDKLNDKSKLNNIIKNYDEEKLKKLKFTEYSYLDLLPKNCFLIDDVFYVFDQEWVEKYYPVEYILYRAIQNSSLTNNRKELLIQRYNILEYQDLFKSLEAEFGNEVIDKIMLYDVFNRKVLSREEAIATMQHYNNLVVTLQKTNDDFKKEIERLTNELHGIYNSMTWKMTVPIRKIGQLAKSDKKNDNNK